MSRVPERSISFREFDPWLRSMFGGKLTLRDRLVLRRMFRRLNKQGNS